MAGKREKPEENVSKLRQVEVPQGQGTTVAEAVSQIGLTQQTFYRWRKLYGGMGRSQLARLKELEKENQRLRRAVPSPKITVGRTIMSEFSPFACHFLSRSSASNLVRPYSLNGFIAPLSSVPGSANP